MREHESSCKILSPLPTLATLGKVSCAVLGSITPVLPASPMTSRPWAHLSIGAGQIVGDLGE
jgi:hypothetical protein